MQPLTPRTITCFPRRPCPLETRSLRSEIGIVFSVRWASHHMLDSDLYFVGFVLFLVLAALLFPGGPGTPRRLRVSA